MAQAKSDKATLDLFSSPYPRSPPSRGPLLPHRNPPRSPRAASLHALYSCALQSH